MKLAGLLPLNLKCDTAMKLLTRVCVLIVGIRNPFMTFG